MTDFFQRESFGSLQNQYDSMLPGQSLQRFVNTGDQFVISHRRRNRFDKIMQLTGFVQGDDRCAWPFAPIIHDFSVNDLRQPTAELAFAAKNAALHLAERGEHGFLRDILTILRGHASAMRQILELFRKLASKLICRRLVSAND